MPALSRVSFFPRVLLLIAVAAAQGSAAITWDGDIDPADPTAWTLDTDGSIGRTAEGTLAVDAGSGLLSDFGFIGRYVWFVGPGYGLMAPVQDGPSAAISTSDESGAACSPSRTTGW